MANIKINGAVYEDVPSIEVPNESGEMVEYKERMTPYEACIADFKARGWTEYEVGDTLTLEEIRTAEVNHQFIARLPSTMTTIPSLTDCHNLVLRSFPTTTTTTLSSNCFQYDDNIYCDDFFSSVTEVNSSAFYGCTNLKLTELNDILSYIGSYAFMQCRNIMISEIPQTVTTLGGQSFQMCSAIENMKTYPNLAKFASRVFYDCRLLNEVDTYVSSIDSEAFAYDSNLSTLILRNTNLVTLSSSNALTATPIKNGTGYIYVPSALIDSYKTATNWSVYASQFRALEDYTVDGTITGELDESKI